MTNLRFSILLITLVGLFTACKDKAKSTDTKNQQPSKEKVSYFGQKTPGMIPEVFAPGVVSVDGRHEYGIAFSPNLDELYYSAGKADSMPRIFTTKLENGKWTPPIASSFTKGLKAGEMHPFVSFDGSALYFTAHNPDYTDTKIWKATRMDGGWGEATKLDSPINQDEAFYLNQAKNGDTYYTNVSKFKLYTATNVSSVGEDTQIPFGLHGFISPSNDYLVFNASYQETPEREDNDIFVCFKMQDGSWGEPINLGETVNSTYFETCPSITPDGKYLFFSRYDEADELSNFYWVSTDVVEAVRPKS